MCIVNDEDLLLKIVVVLLWYRCYLFLCPKSNLTEFPKRCAVFVSFIIIFILRQINSIFFLQSDFILFITVLFSYYKRFFYSVKNTPHYKYALRRITL